MDIFGLCFSSYDCGFEVFIYWFSYIFYSASVIVAGIGAILSALIFSTIINTGTALLWKINISNNSSFSNKLPHLLVKTKTGSVFFGQLYDPLDSKVLVLRKSKLMHGGQIVEDKNDLILWTSQESAGDYWIIPWNDIESIKIIEEGLYFPPESSTDNFISQSTDNDFKEEKSRKNAETDSKPRT